MASANVDELQDEIRFLRGVLEVFVGSPSSSWLAVLLHSRRYQSPLGEPLWRQRYTSALLKS